jgi:predicted DNA-binding protein (MmcQ/YjbR family)
MNIEEVRNYCLQKRGVLEDFPFGDSNPVMKVGGKMFALLSLDEPPSVNLKCDPSRAIELREVYPSIIPGYHMNKRHWNTVMLDGSLPLDLIVSMVDHSYELVLGSLSSKTRYDISESEK